MANDTTMAKDLMLLNPRITKQELIEGGKAVLPSLSADHGSGGVLSELDSEGQPYLKAKSADYTI